MTQVYDSGFIGSDYRSFAFGPDLDVTFEKPRNISLAGLPLYSDPGVSLWIRHTETISHHFMFTPEEFEVFCSALDIMRTKVAYDVLEWREKTEASTK